MWLFFALSGYLLNAFAAIIDKILLSKAIPDPKIYTLAISILGLVALIIAPFGIHILDPIFLILSLVTGVFFVLALWSFFTALKETEASRVVPVVGAIQPIVLFFIAKLFIGESLNEMEILAIVFLILGGVFISIQISDGVVRKSYKWLFYAISSGILYAVYFGLTKYLFEETDFINGFIWPRVGAAAAALIILYSPGYLSALKNTPKSSGKKSFILFILGQIFGALFFLLIAYAIYLGSVTLVNALQGAQYAFVFIISVIIAIIAPNLKLEKLSAKFILLKLYGIIFIFTGILLIQFNS